MSEYTKKLINKNLASPFSTGGGGYYFEAHVQACFVSLMLTGGFAPCLPSWPIVKVKLQGKIDGFETDDVIVYSEIFDKSRQCKLLGQIKHSIAITRRNKELGKVLKAAWSDFNNQELFNKNQDIIALITSYLSATDARNVLWLLNQARHTSGSSEFFRNVKQSRFSPSKSVEKLDVFRHHLKVANNGVEISEEELFSFLKKFRLLVYDLGEEIGVVLSLLHSHFSQFDQPDPEFVWSRVVDIVQTWNKDAGTISKQNLPEDILAVFRKREIVKIPDDLSATFDTPQDVKKSNWLEQPYVTDLALVSLIGSWNENFAADKAILSKLFDSDYESWILKVQEILHSQGSPLVLSNGQWKVTERLNMLGSIGSRIFDQHLEKFRSLAVTVLTEKDPSFELHVNERYAASIRGKVLSHSTVLRQGLSEGLAILGCHPDLFSNCTHGKVKATVISAVDEIFGNSDWILWGSLNFLLPALAEAAPDDFLDKVDHSLNQSPCPFDQFFTQESDGIFGGNYMTGLLWALEALAWNKDYLVRVCVLLAALASHDPQRGWTNSATNSLVTILLPWYPQTLATPDKRKVAVKTICNEWPEIGWNVILQLLPNQLRTTSGSNKPKWSTVIPDDSKNFVTLEEYKKQVWCYAELAVSTAGFEAARLTKLVEKLNNLPRLAFHKLIEVLDSSEIFNLPENEKLSIWKSLKKVLNKHKRYPNDVSNHDSRSINRIAAIETKLSPKNPLNLHQILFTGRDFDLYEENDNWKEQQVKLDKRRDIAIEEIFKQGGIEFVVLFAQSVTSPDKVGYALGFINDPKVEKFLFSSSFNLDNQGHSELVRGFIQRRHETDNWVWTDRIDKTSWNDKRIASILVCLPFTNETWKRAGQWLGRNESEYWIRTRVNPYQTEENLEFAIDKLIEYGRPHAATDCLDRMRYDQIPICANQCVRALLAGLASTESSYEIDEYRIEELIKYLQSIPSVSQEELFKVEWAYLPLLTGGNEGRPKTLEKILANDPEFFCELIKLIYYSQNENKPRSEPSEEENAIATNAWRLLHHWQIPPGLQEDGNFCEEEFTNWLRKMKVISKKSGHLDAALTTVGGVLIHSPPGSDDLWIHPTIAGALNER